MTTLRRLVLAVVLCAVLAAPAAAQVAFVDSSSAQDITGAVTTLVVPSTACTGSNTGCIVYATWRDTGESVTSVTCNAGAVTLTRVPNFPKAAVASGVAIDAFYTLGSSFTATCTITWNSAPFRVYGHTVTFSGVHQTTPFDDDDAQDSNAGTNATADLTLTTQTSGMVVDALHIRAQENVTPDGSQTEREEQQGTGLDTSAVSTLAASGASTTVGWTWTTGANFRHAAIALAPAAGGGGGVINLHPGSLPSTGIGR